MVRGFGGCICRRRTGGNILLHKAMAGRLAGATASGGGADAWVHHGFLRMYSAGPDGVSVSGVCRAALDSPDYATSGHGDGGQRHRPCYGFADGTRAHPVGHTVVYDRDAAGDVRRMLGDAPTHAFGAEE